MNIWSRLGVSVALAAMFCIVMLEAFQNKSYYDEYKWYICAGFMVVGIALFLIGQRLSGVQRAARSQSQQTVDDSSADDESFFLLNISYWGTVFIMFGIIIIFIVPTFRNKKDEKVVARAPSPATNAAPKPTNQEPAAPILKLQGLVYRQPNPSVLINGRTYFIGDPVEDGKLIAIATNSATVEWRGKTILLQAPE